METNTNILTNHPFMPSSWLNAYLDLVSIVAYKAANLCVGAGIIFDSEDKKIQTALDNWAIKENLQLKIWKWVFIQSLIGRAHLWLMRNETNELELILGEPLSNTRCSIYNENVVAAQIFTSKNQGDKGWYFQFDFTPNQVKVTKWVDDKQTILGTIHTGVPPTAIMKTTTTFETGFDVVPLIETTNIPKPNWFPNNTMVFHPDWEPAINLIPDFQEIIKQKRKERRKNQTWFNGYLTPEIMEAIIKQGGDMIETMKDGLVQSNASNYVSKGQLSGFEITLGNPPMENYNGDWLHTSIEIFNACGYNHPRENQQVGYQNKTATLMNGVLDEQTTRLKQNYYSQQLSKLIDLYLIDKGLWKPTEEKWERPYKIEFKSCGLSDMVLKNQIVLEQYTAGLISPIESLQQLYDIPQHIAEQKYAEARAYGQELIEDNQEESEDDTKGKSALGTDLKKDVIK